MKTVDAAEFKERCLALLDCLGPDGLVVTKQGNPIARVTPIGQGGADLIGSLRGQIRVTGDIYTTGTKCDAIDQS